MNITPLENWISGKTGIPGSPEPKLLLAYQLDKLRETLRLVMKSSRFYQERLGTGAPDSIRSMADVSSLPFTYPEDLAARGIDFLCVSPHDIDRIITLSTSGTTGLPKRVYFTDEDQAFTTDFFHHGMMTFTDETDRVMVFMPGKTPGSVGDLLEKGLARFGCTAVIYGPIKEYDDALNALISEKITGIVGIPSQILTLSRCSGAEQVKLKSVLLSADYVPRAASASISETWGAAVYGHYGMTETGLGGGVECSARNGYHLREADLLFEIIDPVTSLPVDDGEYGEIVFSTLTRRGMPLIRYRTGDMSRFLTEPCPCGTVLRRLDHVSGRIKEAIRLSNHQLLSITQLDEIILADTTVRSYGAALMTRHNRDCLHITVRPSGRSFDAAHLKQYLQAALISLFKEDLLPVEVCEGDVGFFTTGTSKRFIADKRN